MMKYKIEEVLFVGNPAFNVYKKGWFLWRFIWRFYSEASARAWIKNDAHPSFLSFDENGHEESNR